MKNTVVPMSQEDVSRGCMGIKYLCLPPRLAWQAWETKGSLEPHPCEPLAPHVPCSIPKTSDQAA